MNENNEKRLIAAQIITELFEVKEIGQIQLLLMQCVLSDKHLNPVHHEAFVVSQAEALGYSVTKEPQ